MKPLSILLDARKLGDGGIGIYIENLIEGLLSRKREGYPLTLSLIVGKDETENRFASEVNLYVDKAKKYSLDEYFGLPRRLNAAFKANDIFHSPHYTLPRGVPIPSVVTIHDAIHLMAPETISQRVFGSYLLRSALKRATQVVTVSGVSLARLGRIAPGVPVTVVQNSLASGIEPVSVEFVSRAVKKYSLRQPFVLFVGSDRPHKGFDILLGALESLKEFSPMLVAVGERYSKRTKDLASKSLGAERIKFIDTLSREELVALYNGARAVVVPSRMEGFGLVALEALACGAPLVCTPEMSLKEVAGNCAWYSQGFTAAEVAEAIRSCFSNREIAEEKAEAGLQRASEFGQERSTEAHLQVYQSLLPDYRSRQIFGASLQDREPISYLRDSLEYSNEGIMESITLPDSELPNSMRQASNFSDSKVITEKNLPT